MPDLHNVPAAYADEETVDTDFVHHLVRGAELLQTGDASQARGMLERALRLRPKNQRGQNLLALSYFRLGMFDRAEEIYRALITDYPNDAALRINLGLVHLKTGRTDDAIAAFSAALEITPNHKKAQNYLGLTYLQRRDGERAKEWFEKAGNTAMLEKVTALAVTGPPLQAVGEGGLQILESKDVPFTAAAETTPGRPAGVWTTTLPPGASTDMPAPSTDAILDLASFTASLRVDPSATVPFAVSPTGVIIQVQTEMFVRLEGLVAVFGALEFKPSFKRFRGRVTEKPFGEGPQRIMLASGKGRIWVAPGKRSFHALEIGDEPAYFREDVLFAFEETLSFENGRVPSKQSGDLQLVHLRSRGRALITSQHAVRTVDVTKDEPCRVPMDVLLGWHGSITPRIVTIAEEASPGAAPLAAVELTGEGRLLLDTSSAP